MTIEDYFYSILSAEEIESNIVGAVVWNKHLELTPDAKAIARENIGAGQGDSNFRILAYFATLEELRASLTIPPVTGDAYGIGPGFVYTPVANEDLAPNPSAAGYYVFYAGSYVPTADVMIDPGTTYYELVYDEELQENVYTEVDLLRPNPAALGYYVYVDGVYALTEDVVPMTGTVYYEYVAEPGESGEFVPVTIIEPNPSEMGLFTYVEGAYAKTTDTSVVSGTAYYTREFIPYDIYVWDALHNEWVNNGPLRTAADIIDDGANDLAHALSSKKTRELCDTVAQLPIGNERLVNGAVTADKIVDGSVSHVYSATIGTNWLGINDIQMISPDGQTSDYTITAMPSMLVSLEETVSGIFLVEGTDFTYDSSTGILHFTVKPELGNETYKATYPTNNPPYRHTINIPGMLANDTPIVDINPSDTYADADLQLDSWRDVYKVVAVENGLTVYAHHPITRQIPIQIVCIRK